MYKTITETFPEELIEMLEEEDFEFISEEINNGIATLHFTVRQIKNVFMILIFPISLNRKSQLTGLNWLAMHCQII